ncbi:MAG TPA: tRNA epoxyqueuosine(34) reductase QueG [Hyphomicrobiales bacterium]|nr:tRNA epoxyqueuosine(34) reductase QueG [Hyphomicrobiales bacterium]
MREDGAKGGDRPSASLSDWTRRRALQEGFDAAGIAWPSSIKHAASGLYAYLEAGFHGEMTWLPANAERRADPRLLWQDVRSVVMLGMNYAPHTDPLAALGRKSHAAISVYAQGADYHDVIKAKLKTVARDLARHSGTDVKVFVDTAPVMEKPLAQAAGLGWQGKHTNLVSREFGSWLFLGAIFTTALLEPSPSERERCGSCRRCLDICPTRAFPAPFQIDARRCISYLTIEHKGQIPREFRTAIGNRVYGCDDCLAVCPWNKFARTGRDIRFEAGPGADNPPLAELLSLDDAAFRSRFKGSPIKRTGRNRFVRNALVAAGNSGDPSLIPHVAALLEDSSSLVRGTAVWAFRRLVSMNEAESPADLASYRAKYARRDEDPEVLAEWTLPL